MKKEKRRELAGEFRSRAEAMYSIIASDGMMAVSPDGELGVRRVTYDEGTDKEETFYTLWHLPDKPRCVKVFGNKSMQDMMALLGMMTLCAGKKDNQ